MPRQGMPQTMDFWRPWGFDRAAYSAAIQEYKRQQDLDHFEKWGFFPEQRAGVLRAAQRGEQDFAKAIEALTGFQEQVIGGDLSRLLQGYYLDVIGGRHQPFTPAVLASLATRITDPFYRAARSQIENARANFAARGLERSGGLISLENRLLSEAIGRAIAEEGALRTQGALENFMARERGSAGLANLVAQQQQALGQIATQIANLYASRQHDPVVESLRGATGDRPLKARGDEPYRPPPETKKRSTSYNFDPTGAWAATSAFHTTPGSTNGRRW